MKNLNETERNLLCAALHLIAEKYSETAKTIRDANAPVNMADLAAIFDNQAIDAIRLAELIRDSEGVTIQ
jgi:hypothetical protein